ncbi:serine protease [Streptomyces luteireticuli]|uniref:serine protease n=1 Tax=Streptomyces luteireticuli TaxID=173858 RepID=UPI003556ED8F
MINSSVSRSSASRRSVLAALTLTLALADGAIPAAHAAGPETYTLTVRHLDRAGRSTGSYETTVTGLSGPGAGRAVKPHGDSGTTTVRLPKGRYLLDSYLPGGSAAAGADWVVQPRLDLDRNTTVTVDARTTAPVDVSPPDRSADFLQGAMFVQVTHGGTARVVNRLAGSPRLRVGHLGPAAEAGSVKQWYDAYWTTKNTTYALGDSVTGDRALTGLTRHPAAKDLATVRVQGAARPGAQGSATADVQPAGLSIGASRKFPVPGATTFLVTPGRGPWEFVYWAPTAPGAPATRYTAGPLAVRAGSTTTLAFDNPVLGPTLTGRHRVVRSGNRLAVDVPLLADGSGHAPSASAYATASTTLHRDGKPVGTRSGAPGRAEFTVPPGRASYRVTSTAQRKGASGAATRVTAAWTFVSRATTRPTPLPVSVVRFSPRLAPGGTAVAGGDLRIPVAVEGAAAGGRVRSLKVSVSMDGGKSWTRVPVERDAVTVRNPRAGTGVSLRAELTDTAGNTLAQTVVDAYRTR